ncbi:MAG: hypothetical protein RIR18_1511 [Pseudomonadota bacterium]|jgi:hypothetical protein
MTPTKTQKIILPAEVKVCGTCTYWDGERQVDNDNQLVVVASDCEGECLVQEVPKNALQDTRQECDCEWDDLGGDGQSDLPSGEGVA